MPWMTAAPRSLRDCLGWVEGERPDAVGWKYLADSLRVVGLPTTCANRYISPRAPLNSINHLPLSQSGRVVRAGGFRVTLATMGW